MSRRSSEKHLLAATYGVLGGAIVLIAAAKLAVLPKLSGLREMRAEERQLVQDITELRGQEARFHADAAANARIDSALTQATTPARGTGAVVSELVRRHASSTCEIGRVVFDRPEAAEAGAERVPFEMDVVARYGEVVALLEDLERNEPIVHVDQVTLSSDADRGFAARARLAGALYVIR